MVTCEIMINGTLTKVDIAEEAYNTAILNAKVVPSVATVDKVETPTTTVSKEGNDVTSVNTTKKSDLPDSLHPKFTKQDAQMMREMFAKQKISRFY